MCQKGRQAQGRGGRQKAEDGRWKMEDGSKRKKAVILFERITRRAMLEGQLGHRRGRLCNVLSCIFSLPSSFFHLPSFC
jgi:hypothetical protein